MNTLSPASPKPTSWAVPLRRRPGFQIPGHRRTWAGLGAVGFALALAVLLVVGYLKTQTPVTLVLNGQLHRLRTHQRTVGALLEDLGLSVHPEDILTPSPDTLLTPNTVISLRRARPVTVEVDGRVIRRRTHATSITALLEEVGVEVRPQDQVIVSPSGWEKPQGSARHREVTSRGGERDRSPLWASTAPAPLRVVIRRAIPFYVNDGGVLSVLYTTAATVGEALREHGIDLYLADQVTPPLTTQVFSGMHIYIQRSIPITIQVDGRSIRTRTRQKTVGQALAEAGVALLGKDYTDPPPDTPISDDMVIRVVRVQEDFEIEQEPIPYEVAWKPDPNMELDDRRLEQEGADGVIKRRYRLVYENGREVARILEDEWVGQEPITKVIAYGTKIVVRDLETPEGTLQYWRKIRMFATSYTAATCGKDPSHPLYGITRLGWKMRRGIVAVDPRVIPLRSRVYIPGYGIGVAGDTGGAIKGRHIDLGYDEDNFRWWYHWVDVYVLTPVPPANEIRWILPDWPPMR